MKPYWSLVPRSCCADDVMPSGLCARGEEQCALVQETRNVKGAPGKPPEPQPWTAFQGRQEQAQPLQASIVDNGVQHNTRAMRSREGSARESSRKSGGSIAFQ